jgi:sulfofructose kinase
MTGGTWDVLGIGENSVDDTLRLAARLGHGRSGKVEVLNRSTTVGGQVATTLAACAAFGLKTAYAGVFGDDEPALLVRAEMERRGIDLACAQVRQAPNRRATILVGADGERTVLWSRDPRLALQPSDVRADVIAGARLVHVDNVDEPAAIRAAQLAREAGALVTSDIDTVSDLTDVLVAEVSVAIFAEDVPQALTGEPSAAAALWRLRERYQPRSPALCVTHGRRGAVLLYDGQLYESPGVAVTAVDTTGAGDVFRGGFITAWLEGRTPSAVLRFANTAAALSCGRTGAMPSVPSLAEVRSALEH